jgi:hypothetical protein
MSTSLRLEIRARENNSPVSCDAPAYEIKPLELKPLNTAHARAIRRKTASPKARFFDYSAAIPIFAIYLDTSGKETAVQH